MCNRFWQMPRLSSDARYMMAYLLDSPHKREIGYYYLPLEYASCDMGIPVENVQKAMEELETVGMAKYDSEARMVMVIDKGKLAGKVSAEDILAILQEVPASPLATELLQRLADTGCISAEDFEKVRQHPLGQEIFCLHAQNGNMQAEKVSEAFPEESKADDDSGCNEADDEATADEPADTCTAEPAPAEPAPAEPEKADSKENASNDGEDGKESKEQSREPWEDDFENIWAKYPRKIGKQAAKKAYCTRLKKGEITYVLASKAVENYSYICKKKGTEASYIMHGSTFFGPEKRFSEYLDDGEGLREFNKPSILEELAESKRFLAPKFNTFWTFYPKKEGKEVAENNFAAIVSGKEHTADELISAAKNYARKCENEGKSEQYIMKADSFLHLVKKPFRDYLDRVERINPFSGEAEESSFAHEEDGGFEEAPPDEDTIPADAPDGVSDNSQPEKTDVPENISNAGDSDESVSSHDNASAEPLPDIQWGDEDEDEDFQIPDDHGFPDDQDFPF